MNRKSIFAIIALAVLLLNLFSVACGGATGTLQFRANGEDFIRQGFESKDGWNIEFEHVYINLAQVAAYQASPPYDPDADTQIIAKVTLSLGGTHTVDLAEGGPDADTILVGQSQTAAVGYYNAISWKMLKATSGLANGHSLVMIGSAEKDDQTIDFNIQIDNEYLYQAGDYIGDELKGVVVEDGTADLEMTFHFDHIFGDAGADHGHELNTNAPGFQPFADLSVDGVLDINMTELQSGMEAGDYQLLLGALITLGHVGEGHSHCEEI